MRCSQCSGLEDVSVARVSPLPQVPDSTATFQAALRANFAVSKLALRAHHFRVRFQRAPQLTGGVMAAEPKR